MEFVGYDTAPVWLPDNFDHEYLSLPGRKLEMTNLEIAYFTLLIVIFDAPERLLFGKIYFKSKKTVKQLEMS